VIKIVSIIILQVYLIIYFNKYTYNSF
jgi:hypothetical protein